MFTDLLSHVRLGLIQTVSDPTLLSIMVNGRDNSAREPGFKSGCKQFARLSFFRIFLRPMRKEKRINIRLFLKVQFRMFCVLRMFVSSALFLFFYTWRDLKNQGHPATLHTTRSPAIDGMALRE